MTIGYFLLENNVPNLFLMAGGWYIVHRLAVKREAKKRLYDEAHYLCEMAREICQQRFAKKEALHILLGDLKMRLSALIMKFDNPYNGKSLKMFNIIAKNKLSKSVIEFRKAVTGDELIASDLTRSYAELSKLLHEIKISLV